MGTRKPTELDNVATRSLGSKGFELVEAQGQQDVVHNDRIPTDMGRGVNGAPETFLALGFKGGKVCEGQEAIFRQVTLPNGWVKKATNNSMLTVILDPHGRERAGLFFKNAMYDYYAHGELLTRYYYADLYNALDGGGSEMVAVVALDRAVPYDTPFDPVTRIKHKIVETFKCKQLPYKERDRAAALAKAWLDKEFPKWEDVLAYWENDKPAKVTVRAGRQVGKTARTKKGGR